MNRKAWSALNIILLALCMLAAPLWAQEDGGSDGGDTQESQESAADAAAAFGLDLSVGVQSFPNPDYDPTDPDSAEFVTYQSLGLQPEFSVGNFGVGLDLTLNYTFTGPNTGGFEVRAADWVPNENLSFLDIYLPKIQYVRWAQPRDPLYIRLGNLQNATLGNGFIVGGYTNTQFLPDRRLFGLRADLDGALFSFPYVGVQTFVGNLAAFDVFAGRLFGRPLLWSEIPILQNLEIGTTLAVDGRPFYHAERRTDTFNYGVTTSDGFQDFAEPDNPRVTVWGADALLPLLTNPVISLSTFGDYVRQADSGGGMLGFGGRLVGIITYGAQLRVLGDGFIPTYFDSSYDLFRVRKFAVYNGDILTEGYVGWFASAGFSLLEDGLVFRTSIDGPFGGGEQNATFKNPNLRAVLEVNEGVLPGFTFEASYDKKGITSFSDLASPADAVIGAVLSYRTGPAVVSFVYDLQYDPTAPEDEQWQITSGLETSLSIF